MKKVEDDTFIRMTIFYLELETEYANMCDSELVISKEVIRKTELLMNAMNVAINHLKDRILDRK